MRQAAGPVALPGHAFPELSLRRVRVAAVSPAHDVRLNLLVFHSHRWRHFAMQTVPGLILMLRRRNGNITFVIG